MRKIGKYREENSGGNKQTSGSQSSQWGSKFCTLKKYIFCNVLLQYCLYMGWKTKDSGLGDTYSYSLAFLR